VHRCRLLTVGLCLAWFFAVGTGIAYVSKYQNLAGDTGATPRHWPNAAPFQLTPAKFTLLLFAHPQCPCTRATLEELNRLLARCGDRVDTHVFFLQSAGLAANWTRSGLWSSAAEIPGVTLHEDLDGATARRFGAETSGYALLYDTRGELLFRGGITAGRGHAGDNAGENMILAQINSPAANVEQTPVYGCSLLTKCSPDQPETAR